MLLEHCRTAPLIPQPAPALHASNSTGDLFDSGGGFPNYSSSSINNHRAASTIAPPFMSPSSNSLTSNSSSTWNSNNVGLKVFDPMAKSLGNTTPIATNNGPVAGGARALASHFETRAAPPSGPPIPPRPLMDYGDLFCLTVL
ncbi:unnamed protein product [Rodentolepis nana]|uniref:Uncharacterized protein n=1 Tax=Rodentolepis nana TaxID=102285 RepID=A0A0R3T2Y7_RODNA|nr:unnamed protein product [Rodentolepis nana]VDN97200.1 unnamed protein product [Rodentolepis nana]